MDATWYLQRLASMSPTEVVHRTEDAARRRLWRSRPPAPPTLRDRPEVRITPIDPRQTVTAAARRRLLVAADDLLAGRWSQFGRPRTDMTADLDYFADTVNGVRAPDDAFSLGIDHRDEAAVGNIKFVWEPARHQHLTVLAVAYALSGDDRYAERIDAELRHYWRTNPFLRGIHWTSGIELGIRLISWTWIRRLLDGWSGAASLFEDNPTFVEQLGRHQQWLASLGSHGSSANNHVIAEAAGQFVASSVFPLFRESGAWQAEGADELARELAAQTFPEGLNRELASDYHGLVLELGLVAWIEAVLIDHPGRHALLDPLARAFDALHAVVDVSGQPHRQGDSDDANGWLLDPVAYDRWVSLLSTAALVVEPAPWWNRTGGPDPEATDDVRTGVVAACLDGRHEPGRPDGRSITRPALFPNAGLSLLLAEGDPAAGLDELWCVFDHGPHGFLSTAAHAHADALSVEVRSGGVEIVADPGTYCYHGEREWRDHFRSTAAHATLTVDDRDQSDVAGPFLWTRKAEATLEGHEGLASLAPDSPPVAVSAASHDGYGPLGLTHHRRVTLRRGRRELVIADRLEAAGDGPARPLPVQLTLPLGPDVDVELSDGDGGGAPVAALRWKRRGGEGVGRASVTLDAGLSWGVLRGSESQRAGWYSAHFGTKVPAAVLVGRSPAAGPGAAYTTVITFLPHSPGAADQRLGQSRENQHPRTRIRRSGLGRLPGRCRPHRHRRRPEPDEGRPDQRRAEPDRRGPRGRADGRARGRRPGVGHHQRR